MKSLARHMKWILRSSRRSNLWLFKTTRTRKRPRIFANKSYGTILTKNQKNLKKPFKNNRIIVLKESFAAKCYKNFWAKVLGKEKKALEKALRI